MSDSDTSSDANWALHDVNHGIVKGRGAKSKRRKPRKPRKKPAKGNKFIWDWEALTATILLLLFLMALAYLVVTSVYSFLFHNLLGTARHSTINIVGIPTGKPATATVTTTETVTTTSNTDDHRMLPENRPTPRRRRRCTPLHGLLEAPRARGVL